MCDKIQVAIKVRPLIAREQDENLAEQWIIHENTLRPVNGSASDSFTFDHVFGTTVTNEYVYNTVVGPITEAAVRGFNGTVFAYGQTASGKTYTMMGSKTECGITELVINDIFKLIGNFPNRTFFIRANFIEIYNEKVYDLLDRSQMKKQPIKLHEDVNGTVSLNNVKYEMISTPQELMNVMRRGEKYRQTGETNMNERSSRSHTIFRIIVESRLSNDDPESGPVQVSHLNLVDLAGSERIYQTGATGTRLKEGTHINKSLSTLSLVIKQLSEMSDNSTRYVNFRDSKLTRILQSSLGGNTKTLIICAITPTSLEESQSTLAFASRAKVIKNKPKVNEVISSDALLKRYAKKISQLQDELERTKSAHTKYTNQEEENRRLQERILLLQKFMLQPNAGTPSKYLYSSDILSDKILRRQTWGGSVKNLFPFKSRIPPPPLTPFVLNIDEDQHDHDNDDDDDAKTKANNTISENSFVAGENFNFSSVNTFDPNNSVLLNVPSVNMDLSVPMEEFELELIESMKENIKGTNVSNSNVYIEMENLKNINLNIENKDCVNDVVEELKNNHDKVDKLRNELIYYQRQLDQQKKVNVELNYRLEEFRSECTYYKTKCEAQQKNIEDITVQMNEVKFQLQQTRHEQREGTTTDDTSGEMEKLRSEVIYLRKQYDELKQFSKDEVDIFNDTVQELQKENSQIKDENAKYQDEISVLRRISTERPRVNDVSTNTDLPHDFQNKGLAQKESEDVPIEKMNSLLNIRQTNLRRRTSEIRDRYRPALEPIVERQENIEPLLDFIDVNDKNWQDVNNIIHDCIQEIIVLQNKIANTYNYVDRLENERELNRAKLLQMEKDYENEKIEICMKYDRLLKKLTNELDDVKVQKLQKDKQNQQLLDDKMKLQKQYNDLTQQLQMLNTNLQIAENKNQLLKTKNECDQFERSFILMDSEEQLKGEGEKYNLLSENYEKLLDEMKKIQKENCMKEKQILELTENLTITNNEKFAEIEKYKSVLEDFQRITEELEKIKFDMSDKEKQIVHLQEQLQSESEKYKLTENYEILLDEFNEIKNENCLKGKQILELNENLRQSKQECTKLIEQLNIAQQAKSKESVKYRNLYEEFFRVTEDFNKINDDITKRDKEIVQLQEQLNKENAKNYKLSKNYEKLLKEFTQVTRGNSLQEMEQNCAQLVDDLNIVKQEKSMEMANDVKMEFSNKNKEVVEQKQLEGDSVEDTRQQQIVELTKKLQEIEQKHIQQSVADNEKYRNICKDFDKVSKELNDIKIEIFTKEQRIVQLEKEKINLETQCKNFTETIDLVSSKNLSTIDRLEKEKCKLSQNIVQVQQQYEQLRKEFCVQTQALQDTIRDESKKYKMLLESFEALEIENCRQQEQLVKLRMERMEFDKTELLNVTTEQDQETKKLSEELKEMKQKYDQIVENLNNVKTEKLHESEKLKKLIQNFNSVTKELSNIKAECYIKNEQILQLNNKNTILESECASFIEKIDSMNTKHSQTLDRLQKEKHKLTQDILEIQQLCERMSEDFNTQLNTLKTELSNENKKYKILLDNHNDMRKQYQELKIENSSNDDLIAKLKQEKSEFVRERDELTQQIKLLSTKYTNDIDRLKDEKRTLHEDTRKHEQTYKKLIEDFDMELNKLKREKSEEGQKYKILLQNYEKTIDAFNKLKLDQNHKDKQMLQLKERNCQLEKQCREHSEQIKSINTNDLNKIDHLQMENRQLRNELQKNLEDFESKKQEFDKKLKNLQNINREIEREREKLQEQYHELLNKHHEHDKKLNSYKIEAEEKLQMINKQNETVKDELLLKIDLLEKEKIDLDLKLQAKVTIESKQLTELRENEKFTPCELPDECVKNDNKNRVVEIFLLQQQIRELETKYRTQSELLKRVRSERLQAHATIKQLQANTQSIKSIQKIVPHFAKIDKSIQVNDDNSDKTNELTIDWIKKYNVLKREHENLQEIKSDLEKKLEISYSSLKKVNQNNSCKISELQNQLVELNTQCEQFKQENMELQQRLNELNTCSSSNHPVDLELEKVNNENIIMLPQKIDQIIQTDEIDKKDLKSQLVVQLESENVELKRELSELETQLQNTPSNSIKKSAIDQADKLQTLKNENVELQRKLSELESQVESMRLNSAQKLTEYQTDKLRKLESENIELKRELSELGTQLQNTPNSKLQTLTKENVELKRKLHELETQLHSMPLNSVQKPLVDQTNKLRILEAENVELQRKLSELETQLRSTPLNSVQKPSVDQTDKLRVLESENVELKRKLHELETQLQNTLTNSEHQNSKLQTLKNENVELKRKLHELENQLHSTPLNSVQKPSVDQTDKLRTLETENVELKRKLSELETQLQSTHTNLLQKPTVDGDNSNHCTCRAAQKLREKSHNIDKLKTTINSLKDQLKKKAIENKTLSIDYQQKLTRIQEQNKQLQNTIDTNTIEKMTCVERKSETSTLVVKLNQRIHALEEQLRVEVQQTAWYQNENELNIKKIHELEDKIHELNPIRRAEGTLSPTSSLRQTRRLSSSKRNEIIDDMRKINDSLSSSSCSNCHKSPFTEIQNIGKENKGIQCSSSENTFQFCAPGSGIAIAFHKEEEIRELKKVLRMSKLLCHKRATRIHELEKALNIKHGEPVPVRVSAASGSNS